MLNKEIPNRSRRSPLQLNPNDIRNSNNNLRPQQQRNEIESWDKTKGP